MFTVGCSSAAQQVTWHQKSTNLYPVVDIDFRQPEWFCSCMLNTEMNLDSQSINFLSLVELFSCICSYYGYIWSQSKNPNFPLFCELSQKKKLQSSLCHITACYGPGMDENGLMDIHGNTMVTSSNVEQFSKCTKIFGSLAFHPQSFARYVSETHKLQSFQSTVN